MGIVAADVNKDGAIDLYVANDLCPNFLFLNKGDGTFEDVSEISGAAKSDAGVDQAGMGVDAEDVDGDGLPDLFVTNFLGEHNALYHNIDGENFQDVSAGAGVVKDSLPDVGWGCTLSDFDNDGHPDIMVVNGHVDNNLPKVNGGPPQEERCKVWRNTGGGGFRFVTDAGPFFQTEHVARGAAFGDLDNDGDIDAVINLLDAKPALLLNESQTGGWIGLDLIGRRSNRAAIGAIVEVHAGGRVLHRQVRGGRSYHSSPDRRLMIGLGDARQVERVEIRWPSGASQTIENPDIGRVHLIREPDAPAPVAVRTARGIES